MKDGLVDYLLRNREDRAMMASLRRGLGKVRGHPVMYPYVVLFLPDDDKKVRWHSWRYFTVAALFGYHPEHVEGRSIGEALSRLERNDSLQKRFTWLLDSTTEELPMRLKSMVSLLKSKKIGIDYHKLFKDLSHWDHPDRFVQLAWANDFYKTTNKNQNKE